MSLKLYKDTQGTELTGEDLPETTHNGFTGGADHFNFFIRNSNNEHSYTNINVDINVTTTEFNYKLWLGSEFLSLAEWDEITQNEYITIPSISNSDSGTYYEIQCRLFCPANRASAEAYTSGEIRISVTANEA